MAAEEPDRIAGEGYCPKCKRITVVDDQGILLPHFRQFYANGKGRPVKCTGVGLKRGEVPENDL